MWGVQYVIIKIGLAVFPPLFFVALRFFIIAVVLIPFIRPPTAGEFWPIVVISVLMGGLNFGLTFAGLVHGQAGGARPSSISYRRRSWSCSPGRCSASDRRSA